MRGKIFLTFNHTMICVISLITKSNICTQHLVLKLTLLHFKFINITFFNHAFCLTLHLSVQAVTPLHYPLVGLREIQRIFKICCRVLQVCTSGNSVFMFIYLVFNCSSEQTAQLHLKWSLLKSNKALPNSRSYILHSSPGQSLQFNEQLT